MYKIGLEEHFLLPEFDGYLQTLLEGVRSPSFDAVMPQMQDLDAIRLSDMDRDEISHSILSCFNWGSVQLDPNPGRAVDMARRMNDALAVRIAIHPNRFSGFAALPLQDAAAAVAEFRRCVTELGFRGALVNGQTQGHYLDEARYWPLWEAAAELDAPIYLHAWSSPADQLTAYEGYPELLGPIWNWTTETATHALRIICSGVFDRYPAATLILGHMGELLPHHMARFDQGWQLSGGAGKTLQPINFYLRNNVLITTSGNVSAASLVGALMSLGADRILFSTDYPMNPGPGFLETLESGVLSEADRAKIYHENAKRTFRLAEHQ